jgi:hypothetical protein
VASREVELQNSRPGPRRLLQECSIKLILCPKYRARYTSKKHNNDQDILFKYLKSKLGHIAASPKKGTAKAIKGTYIFNNEGYPTNSEDNNIANYSRETVYKFVDVLINNTKKITNIKLKKVNRTGDIEDIATEALNSMNYNTFLIGNKGVGKTTLLNYIISVIGAEEAEGGFDYNRVVVIRLDLNKREDHISLIDWIRYKICRIIYRYYNLDSVNNHGRQFTVNLSSNNENMIDVLKKHYSDRLPLMKNIDDYETELRNCSTTDKPIPVKVSDNCFETLYNHCICNENMSFIIMIDGLDQLSLDHTREQVFIERSREVKTLLEEHFLLGSILCSIRHNTYVSNFKDIAFNRDTQLYFVDYVEPIAIWKRKKSYLLSEEALKGQTEMASALRSGDWHKTAYILDTFLENLMAYTYNSLKLDEFLFESKMDSTTAVFDFFKELFGDDNRLIFRAVISIIDLLLYYQNVHKLSDDISAGKRYLVSEALMVPSGSAYYQSMYSYNYDKEQKKIYHKREDKRPIFKNAFNFPDIDLPENQYEKNLILLGVRLLQFLKFNSEAKRHAVLTYLNDFFDYDRIYSDVIIEEYLDYGFIKKTATNKIAITKTGKYLLSSLIYNHTYLNFVSHSTPLPYSYLDNKKFVLKRIDDPEFAAYLILNAVNFYLHVRKVEGLEEVEFNLRVKKNSELKDVTYRNYYGKDLSVYINKDNSLINIHKTIESIINTSIDQENHDLLKAIVKIFKNNKFTI